jgi:hypothetical protein
MLDTLLLLHWSLFLAYGHSFISLSFSSSLYYSADVLKILRISEKSEMMDGNRARWPGGVNFGLEMTKLISSDL